MIRRPKSFFTNRALTLLGSADGVTLDELSEIVSDVVQVLDEAAVNPSSFPTPQTVNILFNSSFIHSVQSWNNTGMADDTRYECYAAFCHHAGEGVAMNPSTVPGANNTLKYITHANYDVDDCDWYWTTGVARMEGTRTVDALLYGNPIHPSYSMSVTMQVVRASQYVFINEDTRLSCGLYANSTAEGWTYLFGDFALDTEVLGTVATPTSRDYLVHARTNRGFTVNSATVTVANAPSDTDFNNGAIVNIQWQPVLNYGVLGYDVYRKTGAGYKRLFTTSNLQTQYQDNGGFTADVVVAFPSADFDHLVAYTATQQSALASVPYSGDPLNPTWSTITFVVRVPASYNEGDSILTAFQWLRYGMFGHTGGRLDWRITDGESEVDGITITSAAAQFSAGQVGMDVTITGKGLTDYAGVVDTYVGPGEITVTPAYTPAASLPDLTVTILGGAPAHSLWTKNVSLSYTEGAAWAPNPADSDGTHGVPPVATNGSTQGGSGSGGGGGDGAPLCVFIEERIKLPEGETTAQELEQWDWIDDGFGGKTQIIEIEDGWGEIFYVQTKNGVSERCTDEHQLYITTEDKRPLKNLSRGSNLVVDDEPSPIKSIHKIMKRGRVRRLSLSPRTTFKAGTGGWILNSNRKNNDGDIPEA